MGNASGRAEEFIADAEMDDGSSSRGGGYAPQPYGDGGGSAQVRRSSSVGYVGGGGGGGGSPPGSPPRPHSPRMFVPQSPVAPLQRAADGPPPVFNQILMCEQQDNMDGPPEKLIPTLLSWTLGGKNVYVEGSWDNWQSKKSVQKSGKDHCILLQLASGVYRYRFIVDGERRFLPDLPCETDNMGNIVNLLDVHDFVPESVDSVSELMAPPSPDSSYGFLAPDDKEFTKEPPALPAQLHLGVLNSRGSEGECARPKHVVLNHLYIEKGWGIQPVVALGHTHRFQSKYVTTVLYKAIER